MRVSRAFVVTACLLLLAGLFAGGGVPGTAAATPATTPQQRVIVLLDEPAALAGPADRAAGPRVLASRRNALLGEQRHLVDRARARGAAVEVGHRWTGLVNGFAATVATDDLASLRAVPGIRKVVPDQQVQLATDVSVPLVGAPEVWRKPAPGGGKARGKGVTIAVVDSGVDYTNASLGEGFGKGHKVVAGHDFANDDPDPMDDNGHGTHVAGIAAGDGPVRGVAPEATLTAYKVVNRSGSGYASDVLAGLEAAVDPANPHRADVVNMSLSVPGDATDPIAQAATVATRNGVVVVASAGNSGSAANAVGSPAVAEGVVSVGASASGIRTPELTMVAPDRLPLQVRRAGISADPPGKPVNGRLVDVGSGSPGELEEAGDLTGKVVAVRGRVQESTELTSPQQIALARQIEDAGAIGMVLYQASSSGPLGVEQLPPPTDDDELLWPLTASGDDFRMDRIVVVGLQELEWEQLTARMAKGPVTVRITGRDMTDRMASFSSRGPTSDYALEPDIVAPGVEIRSAWPTRQWEPGVFRLSGTSMSSPHVAGAAALLRQLDPDAAVERINGRLVGSARLLEDAAPSAQGTGRLDVAAAVRQTVTASPTSLSFGLADTSRNTLRAERKVTLHNDGRKPVLLRLQARPSEQSTGHVVVTPGALVVPPGKSRTATVRLTGRTPDDRAELSGWVEARPIGSSTPVVRVPYLLSVVPVIVQASPDPGPDGTTLLIGTPYDVTAPPVVTVRPPRGKPQTIRAVHDHGTWWRAEYRSDVEGTHEATVRAVTELGPTVTGTGRFEVVPPAPDGVGSWEPVGPNAQAGWIAETPADPDTIALHAYGSLSPWLSTDDGDTWRQVPSLPVADGEGTIVVDPNDARQMWFAVSGYAGAVTFDPTYQGAILHSTDAGRSWRRLAAPDVRYETLVTDTRGRVLVAVTESALQVSRDDGASWQAVPNPAGAGVADVGFSGDDLFVSSSRQVWRVPGLAAGEPGTAHVVYSDEGALRGMAVGDAAVAILDSDEAVEVSTDRGETWEHRYQGPSLGPWDLLMVDDDLVLTTYSGHSFIGRDLGTSWRQVTHPVPGAIPTDVTRRGDGLLWAQQNIGMNLGDPETGELRDRIGVQGHTAYDVEVTSAGELLAGTQLGIYDTEVPTGKVTPDTAEWGLSGGEARSGRSVPLITESSDGSVLWSVHPTTFSAFDVKRSTDGGDTWQTHGRTPGGAHALAVDTRDPDTVAVAFSVVDGAGVHVTRDGGATWRKMFHGRFRALEADPQVHGRLWLGGDEGLFVSDDFGVTLRKVRAGAVTAIDRHGKRLVVAGPDGIAVSTDRGRSFKDARDGDLPTDVTDLVTSPTNDRLLFAGTRKHVANGVVKNGRGVLMSRDGGRSWTNVSRGLQNTSVVSLDMTDDGRWLFAGTTDGGVHRMRVTGR